MKFIKNIKQIVLCLIKLLVINMVFFSLGEEFSMDNSSLLKNSSEILLKNHIGFEKDKTNLSNNLESIRKGDCEERGGFLKEWEFFEDCEDLREEWEFLERGDKTLQKLKNSNKDYELEIVNISNYVLEELGNKDNEKLYILNSELTKKIVYKRLFPNFFFFFYIKAPMTLNILSNVFCWLSLISVGIVSVVFFFLYIDLKDNSLKDNSLKDNSLIIFKKDYKNDFFNYHEYTFSDKNDVVTYKDFNYRDRNIFYILPGIVMFITIINGGLLGYKYGTSGNYDFFLNMILYPIVTYIFPVLFSIFFFFDLSSYKGSRIKIYHIIILLYIGMLLLTGGKKLINLAYVLKYKREVQTIESLVKNFLIKNPSFSYKFISINFIFVYVMIVLCSLSITSALVCFLRLIYVIYKKEKILYEEKKFEKLFRNTNMSFKGTKNKFSISNKEGPNDSMEVEFNGFFLSEHDKTSQKSI